MSIPTDTTPIDNLISPPVLPEQPVLTQAPDPPNLVQTIPIPTPLPDQAVSPSKSTPQPEDEPDEAGIGEKRNPVIRIRGHEFDMDTTIVVFAIIAIWITIWYSSGLKQTLEYDRAFSIIFLLFIVYMLLNIKTSGTTSAGVVYEMNILMSVEQMVSILFGTMVLFALFFKNLPLDESCQPIILRLIMSIIIILTLASLWVNVWTTGRAFRMLRKFKQGVYNIALILFIIIGIIYFKGSKYKCGMK